MPLVRSTVGPSAFTDKRHRWILHLTSLLLLGGAPVAVAGAQSKGSKKAPPPDSVTAQLCQPGDPSCYPVPGVTPQGLPVTVSAGSNSYGFTVTNSGHLGVLYFSNTTCSGVASGCTVSPSSASLASGASTTVTVSYTAASGGGTGTVDLYAQDGTGTYTDDGWINVTVSSTTRPAIVTLAQNGVLRDVGRCVSSCFENTQSYATPYYVTMDVQRSVALQYRSGQAHPLGTVQLDAIDSSQTPADSLSLKLQRANGTFVTFTNGSQEIFFRGGVLNGTTRIAAQFDASAIVTSDSTYTALVKSYWHSGTTLQTNTPVRVMVINESASPYGAGWGIAGLQRVYPGTDGGAVVVDGSGSASFFSGSCVPSTSCTFTAPAGDFSVLSTGSSAYKRHYPDGTDYNFTSVGLLSTVVDRFGNTTQYFYDASNRVTSIKDPTGAATSFAYDAGTGKLSSITTLGVRTSSFSVDASGDLRSVTDPDNITAFHADYATGPHRLTHMVDRRGGAWDYVYAADGTIQADSAPQITASGSLARPTTKFSGPSSRILAAISTGSGTASNPVARGIDTRATVTNPRGNATNFTLNQWGSPTLVQDALNRTATLSYDATTGQPKSVTAVSGRQTSYTWDGPRLTQLVDGPKTIHVAYETVFNQPTHIYGDVTEQWRSYDLTKSSRPLDTTRVAGQGPTTYSFDSYGRILTATDTLGHVTTWYHEPMGTIGNTDSISAPGLLATRFTYDIRGRVITTRHPDGTTDSTYYDTINRVTTTVDGSQHRTSYGYDSLYLRTVTDPKSQQYTFTTNALGWVEQETRPGSSVSLVAGYDANGNVISTTNRRGGQVTHSFDALDRDTVITADGQATHIAYGANDQFVRLANSESTDSLVADAYGRYTRAYVSRPATGGNYSISDSLGSDGTLQSFMATSNRWSGTRGPSFTYDSTKNVKTLTSFAGVSTVTRNRDGLPTQIQYPNGLTASSDFTSDHDVVSMLYSNASPGARFARDSLGRITGRAPANFDDESVYSYNPDGSLASWSLVPQQGFCTFNSSYGYSCNTGIPTPVETYTYDPVGNNVSGGASYTANRLTSMSGYTMTYDEDGNLQSKSGSGFSQTLNWNSLGQLTSVTTNGTTVTFGYDGLGRRIRKSVSGGTTTGYLYSGDDLYMELDSSGYPVTEYAYWPSIDAPHAISKGGQFYYLTQDPQARNITSLVRASDNKVQALYDYTPFGTLRSASFDSVGNSLQFAARQYDSETQLLYFRARYYDPQVGRFISEDPIGLGGGINPYAYAANDPVNGSDPSGLCTWHMHYTNGNTGEDSYYDEEGSCPATLGAVEFYPRGYGSGPIGSPQGGDGGLGGVSGGDSEPGSDGGQKPPIGSRIVHNLLHNTGCQLDLLSAGAAWVVPDIGEVAKGVVSSARGGVLEGAEAANFVFGAITGPAVGGLKIAGEAKEILPSIPFPEEWERGVWTALSFVPVVGPVVETANAVYACTR